MSDTPKYSYWYLSENERKRLESELRAEAARLERLRKEAAEIRRKRRVAMLQAQLRERIQAVEVRFQNLEPEFQKEEFSGFETAGSWESLLEEWRSELDSAGWDEDVLRVQKKVEPAEKNAERLAEMLSVKRKTIRQIEEIRMRIADRGGLQVLPASPTSDAELNELVQSIRDASSLEILEDLRISWSRIAEELRAQCLFFDQTQRFHEIEEGIKAFDRRFLVGENLNLFQKLSEAMDYLRVKIRCVRMDEVAAAFLPVENYFSALEARLHHGYVMLAERKKENERLLDEFESEWKSELEESSFEENDETEEAANVRRMAENRRVKISSQLASLRGQLEKLAPESLGQSLESLRNELEATADLKENARRLRALRERQESVFPRMLWENLARNEWVEFERRQRSLFRQIQNCQNPSFKKDFDALQRFFEEAFERMKPQIQSWTIRRDAVARLASELREYWSFWFSEPSTRQWADEEMTAQEMELEEIQKALDDGVFELSLIEKRLEAWKRMTEQIARAVLDARQSERKRQFLVRRFEEEFRKLGFAVESPSLEDPENPASGIVLSAFRRGEGKTINVRFDQDESEPVLYAVDGFPMPARNIDGNNFRTCDEAQRQLAILHKLLEKHGILMGKVQWEDQLPTDLAKEAMELPDSVSDRRANET